LRTKVNSLIAASYWSRSRYRSPSFERTSVLEGENFFSSSYCPTAWSIFFSRTSRRPRRSWRNRLFGESCSARRYRSSASALRPRISRTAPESRSAASNEGPIETA